LSQIYKASSGGGGSGNVTGPGSSTVGDIVLFNNTTGTLISDSGIAFPIPVASGGTGLTSAGVNGIFISSNAGVPSWLANGTAGYVLTANSGAPPSWQASAGGITGTTTQYDVIVGAGINSVGSVGPGSSGQLLQSGGNAANPAYTTATYPGTATGTGTILRADGTNWSASTSTYPNTNSKGDLLYGSASNVISDLAVSTYYGAPLGNSDGGVPVWLSPRNYIWLYDDFIGTTNTASLGWVSATTNSGQLNSGATSYGVSSANIGVYAITTLTNASSTSNLGLGSTSNSFGNFILGGGYISMVFYSKLSNLSDGTNTYTALLGFMDTKDSTSIANGAYFSYSSSGSTPNWIINTASASTVTSSTSNVAADTNWHRFRIDVNAAASSIAFYIDDTALNVSPLTTNIPTAVVRPQITMIRSAGTTTRFIAVDYFTYYQNLTSSR
jgi:hypothetical protein